MKHSPPRLIEVIVNFLLPPACREHVLGDLYERCTSTWQYMADALNIVPRVILSQVRRMNDSQMLVIEAFAAYITFTTAASMSEGSLLLVEASSFRSVIPALTTIGAFALARVYTTRQSIQMMAALSLTFLSEAVLRAVNSTLAMTPVAIVSGAIVSALLLSIPKGKDMSLRDIKQKSDTVRKDVQRRNLGMIAGVAVLALMGVSMLVSNAISDRVLGGAIMAVSLFLMSQLYLRRRKPIAAMSHKEELERSRDELRRLWAWYVLPFFIGLMMFALRIFWYADATANWHKIIPFAALSICWAITAAVSTKRAARKVQDEIDNLKG